MVVETNAGLVFSNSVVGNSLQQIYSFINDDIMFDVGVLFIFNLKVVLWEGLDGKVGSADGSLMADDVCSFSNLSS